MLLLLLSMLTARKLSAYTTSMHERDCDHASMLLLLAAIARSWLAWCVALCMQQERVTKRP